MFIEKRRAGKRIKYYAVHSFREGKEVVKIRRYLGHNLSGKELERKKQIAWQFIQEQLRHYRIIRDPLQAALSPEELGQLKRIESKYNFRVHHLSEEQWSRFAELFSYNTNAIEGSTLTQREVSELIEKNKVPDKSGRDIEEAKGVVEAVKFIRAAKEHISLDLIKRLHEIVFRDSKHFAGQFRAAGVEVVIRDKSGEVVHRGAPSGMVLPLLKELVRWYDENSKAYPPVLLAAVVHNQFENIHPFQDGNGRVGRLLLNNILIKHNLPPVNIELTRRQEYYEALQAYQKEHNVRPMVEFIVGEYRRLAKQLRG
jgi:Fic family protein